MTDNEVGPAPLLPLLLWAESYPVLTMRLHVCRHGRVAGAQVSLFKFVFPPRNKHATLCTVGFIQPIGGIMPLSELQARWTARVFSGKVPHRTRSVPTGRSPRLT